jgi:hypothetical protein
MFKRKKKHKIYRLAWLNLRINYPISKKSRNARMGKGKGAFFRWAIKIKPLICFVEFFGFPKALLSTILKSSLFGYNLKPSLYSKQVAVAQWGKLYNNRYINTQKNFINL